MGVIETSFKYQSVVGQIIFLNSLLLFYYLAIYYFWAFQFWQKMTNDFCFVLSTKEMWTIVSSSNGITEMQYEFRKRYLPLICSLMGGITKLNRA